MRRGIDGILGSAGNVESATCRLAYSAEETNPPLSARYPQLSWKSGSCPLSAANASVAAGILPIRPKIFARKDRRNLLSRRMPVYDRRSGLLG